MKNRFKLLLILFISILCINVNAEKIEVLVGNQWLKESDNNIIDDKGGRAILDVDEKILYLVNFHYNGKGEYCEYDGEGEVIVEDFYTALYAPDDLTIKLVGENTFTYQAPGVKDDISNQVFAFFGGNVTIEGSGTLNLLNTGTGDPSSRAIGITGSGSFTANNVNLNMNFAYGDVVYGMYLFGNVNFISSIVNIDYKVNNGTTFAGITCDSKFKSKKSNVIMNATNTVMGDNIGVDCDDVSISSSKIVMKFGSAGFDASSAFYSDEVQINDSMLTIYTDTVGFFTEDSLVLNTSIILVKAQGGVLNYDDGPTGSVNLGFSSVKASPDYYLTTPASDFGDTDLKELKNMQYFATTVETNSSEVNYSLNKPGITILTPNLIEKNDLTELDNMNRNFGQDLYIELHTSDDYKKVDDEIII